jgi:hypothetical protein
VTNGVSTPGDVTVDLTWRVAWVQLLKTKPRTIRMIAILCHINPDYT